MTIRARRLRSVLVFTLLGTGAWSASAETLRVDTDRRYQDIEGWGTSLVWWSDAARAAYEGAPLRAAYRDLGLNMLRVDFAKEALQDPSGNLTIPVTLGNNLQQNINQFNFDEPVVEVFGTFADWLDDNALEPERVKIVGSIWSPPHWMKGPTGATSDYIGQTPAFPTPWLSDGGDGNGTSGNSIGGRLRTEDAANLEQYGRYLAAYMEGFEQRYGTPVYALSLQNESTFENPFNSMTFYRDENGDPAPGQYAEALAAVKAAWQEFGIDTKIKGPHHSNIGPRASNPWALNQQMAMIEGIKDHADPTLIDFLDFYGSNYYVGADGTAPTGEDSVRAVAGYYHGRAEVGGDWAFWANAPGLKQDNKPIWFSEVGGEGTQWATGSDSLGAMQVAMNAFNALVHADATSYLYWQILDPTPEENEFALLGLNDLDNPTAGSKKYSAYKQITRYVRPGAVRIDAAFDNGEASVGGANKYDTAHSINAAAFLHQEDQTLTYLLLNAQEQAQSFDIVLPDGFTFGDFEVYRTSATDSFTRLNDLVFVDGRATISLPALSVVTLVGAFTLPAALLGDYNNNGAVDQGDLDLVLLNWGDDVRATGVPAGWVRNPPTGLIGQQQLDGVLLNWGNTAETSSADAPEPGAVGLLLIGGLATRPMRRSYRSPRLY